MAFQVKRSREPIKKFQDLVELVRGFKGGAKFLGGTYLRGHSVASWKLIPTIGRPHEYCGKCVPHFTAEQERVLFHRFRRLAYLHVGRELNEWETLFLARHHRLPVRLLDWTSNPLVALYWACEESEHAHEDGAVWFLERRPGPFKYVDIFRQRSPFALKGVRIIVPLHVAARLTAQSASFTVHERPYDALEDLASSRMSPRICEIETLVRWIVPADKKLAILTDLEKVGVNRRTMYPDLDGLSAGLWHTEVLRRGK